MFYLIKLVGYKRVEKKLNIDCIDWPLKGSGDVHITYPA